MGGRRLGFGSLHSPQEIERAADNYARTLHLAIHNAIPKINLAKPERIRGWWNRELDEISQAVNRLQVEPRREPIDQENATAARRDAVRAAEQSYITMKLQAAGPQDVWKDLKKPKPTHTKAASHRSRRGENPAINLSSVSDRCSAARWAGMLWGSGDLCFLPLI